MNSPHDSNHGGIRDGSHEGSHEDRGGDEHDLNAMAALVEGRLDERERSRLMEHLAECAQCRATLALLGRGANEGHLAAPTRRRWSPAVWLPIAASIAVAAVALRLAFAPEPPAAEPAGFDERLLPMRAGGQVVNGKTFRLQEGVWMDDAATSAGGASTVVVQGRQARDELLARVPELRAYAEVGDRVVVVHDGTIYRFLP